MSLPTPQTFQEALLRMQEMQAKCTVLESECERVQGKCEELEERNEAQRLEIAADYLVMAAWLAYLKSKLLLPVPSEEEGEPSAAEMAAAPSR